MFCTSCGAPLPDRARFCGRCGVPVASTTPAPSPPAPVAPPPVRADAPPTVHPTPPPPPVVPAPWSLDPREFEHPSMQRMNQLLRGSVVLRKSAESLSRKIGKPWYESTFNSIAASPTQYPRILEIGHLAARRLGAVQKPSFHVELDRGYQSATYGSEQDAFVNVGAFLPRLLDDQELLFVLGHEIGHLISQHALWTTTSMFLVGEQRRNLMGEGVMGFLTNPLKLIEGGVESLVANWMRVADFTADRAALLAVGSFGIARRAIVMLHLKSRRELDQLDIDAWIRQAEAQDQTFTRVSQMVTSATPYLGLRLVELGRFARSPEYEALRRKVETGCGVALDGLFDERGYIRSLRPPARGPVPNRPSAPPSPTPGSAPPPQKVRLLRGACPRCRAAFAIRLVALPDRPWIDIPCKACGGTFRLKLEGLPHP